MWNAICRVMNGTSVLPPLLCQCFVAYKLHPPTGQQTQQFQADPCSSNTSNSTSLICAPYALPIESHHRYCYQNFLKQRRNADRCCFHTSAPKHSSTFRFNSDMRSRTRALTTVACATAILLGLVRKSYVSCQIL